MDVGQLIPGTIDYIKVVRNGTVITGASTPPSPAAGASLKGLELVMNAPEMREKLWENAKVLKQGLRNLGFDVGSSIIPIAAWTLKDNKKMKIVYNKLLEKGFAIQLATYVGSEENSVLRIVVFSTHTSKQIDELLVELKNSL